MSKKNNTSEETKVIEKNPSGKSVEELKEIANTLQTQLQHHQTMTIKAHGAVEVISQMIKKSDDESEGKE